MYGINNFSTDSCEDVVVKEKGFAKFSGQEEIFPLLRLEPVQRK
jgi:hypothetical protein